jgi:hypothetical protein
MCGNVSVMLAKAKTEAGLKLLCLSDVDQHGGDECKQLVE